MILPHQIWTSNICFLFLFALQRLWNVLIHNNFLHKLSIPAPQSHIIVLLEKQFLKKLNHQKKIDRKTIFLTIVINFAACQHHKNKQIA